MCSVMYMKLTVLYLLLQLYYTKSIYRGLYFILPYDVNNQQYKCLCMNNNIFDNSKIDAVENNVYEKKRFIFTQNINPFEIIFLFL